MRLIILATMALLITSCSQKPEEKPPDRTPVVVTPNPPAVPYGKRIQTNSGSSFGTTTNGFKTSVSVGNTSTELSGTTTNGFRVKYNVQDPNATR